MKRILALLLCVVGFLAAPVRADVELSFDWYYDQLSPMGEWVEVDGYGYVWHPNGVDADWAPYSDGYWTYTDAGWTWVSYEDWGGICYHYGRWVHLADYGWCWVPGYEWGPAWVSWRRSDDYIGWAPLPPECDWDADRGVSVWVDVHYDIGPRWYSFCRVRDFGAPVIRHVILPRIRNVDFCFSTVNITNISYNRDYGCVFNGGFDYDYIRARCDRPVPALKLVRNTTNIFINNNIIVNAPRGNALVVASPRVAANARNFTRVPAVKRTFKRDAVTRGWAGLEKPETRERLLGKMREESKGLTPVNAPARPVKKEALAALPKEVKLDAPTPGMKRLPANRPSRGALSREDANERSEQPGQAGRPERMRPGGRGETAEAPSTNEPARPNGRPATAETDASDRGGLRRRPTREADTSAEAPVPAGEQQPGRVAEQEKAAGSNRAAEAARENARRQAQENGARESAESAREKMTRGNAERGNGARENLEREANEREQANAARAAAERAQRQRAANEKENASRSAEMERRAQENASRAVQENSARERAAEAAAARRAQMEAQNDRAEQQRRSAEQAEAAQRQAAQRAAVENARREAAERQNENARRQMIERQNDNARREAAQRQAEVQQQRQAALQQRQAEMQRERAAAQQNEMRQRAMESQRQQAAESARARAMENQQRAAAASQARAQAQAQAQQRAAAEAANRRQSESRSNNQENGDPRRRR